MNEIVQKYPLVCLSALNSELFTFPIDSTKTRMQVLGSNDFTKVFRKGWKYRKLYRGLGFAVGRQFVYSGLRMSTYQAVKPLLPDNFWGKCGSALAAGTIAQTVATPLDMRKIRTITGNKSSNPNPFHGMLSIVLRSGANTVGYLASYDIAKQGLIKLCEKEDYLTYSASSIISGLSSAILCSPFDNLKANVMNSDKKKSIPKFFIDTYKTRGIAGIYTGFFANWLRSAPWHFIFWNSFEFYTKLFGVTSI